MRLYHGRGPFLPPPISKQEADKLAADASRKEAEAIIKMDSEKIDFTKLCAADAIDEFVKLLSLEEIGTPDDEVIEKLKTDFEDNILFDPDSVPFALLRGLEDGVVPLPLEEELDIQVIVPPPPSSETSGYSSGSSVGSVSPPGHSSTIKDIKSEKSLEDYDRSGMAFSLGSIKEDAENDPEKVTLGKIKGERKDSNELPADASGPVEVNLELNGNLGPAEFDAYVLMKHYEAQFGSGEWKREENWPGPEMQLLELTFAVAQLEHQMQLSKNEKKLKFEPIELEVEDDQYDEDEEETEGEDEVETEGEDFDSGMEMEDGEDREQ